MYHPAHSTPGRFFLFLFLFLSAAAVLARSGSSGLFPLILASLAGMVLAQACLRHEGLALAAGLSPLPVMLWLGSTSYPVALAFAILLAAWLQGEKLRGGTSLLPAAPLEAMAAVLLSGFLWRSRLPGIPGLLAASLMTLAGLCGLVRVVAFGDEEISRGNRQREIWLRRLSPAGWLMQRRWSFSLTGIGVVLAVLGLFRVAPWPDGFAFLLAGFGAIAAGLLARDGRAALAGLAAGALVVLFCGGAGIPMLLFLLLALTLARSARDWRDKGESVPKAWTRAMEERGAALLLAGLAALIAGGILDGPLMASCLAMAMAAALVLLPAFARTLHGLFPHRRDLETIYKTSAP